MTKILKWIKWISFIIFILVWLELGLELLTGNYDIYIQAVIGAVCFGICMFSTIILSFMNKCSECGKTVSLTAKYCEHCGASLKKGDNK